MAKKKNINELLSDKDLYIDFDKGEIIDGRTGKSRPYTKEDIAEFKNRMDLSNMDDCHNDFMDTAEMIITDEPLDDYHKLIAIRTLAEADGVDPDMLFNKPTTKNLNKYSTPHDLLDTTKDVEYDDDQCDDNCCDCKADNCHCHENIFKKLKPTEKSLHGIDITPQILTAHTANMVINQYTFAGVPCILFGSVNRGFAVMTESITYEALQDLVNTPYIDIVMYTDGHHTTCLKDGTDAITNDGPNIYGIHHDGSMPGRLIN